MSECTLFYPNKHFHKQFVSMDEYSNSHLINANEENKMYSCCLHDIYWLPLACMWQSRNLYEDGRENQPVVKLYNVKNNNDLAKIMMLLWRVVNLETQEINSHVRITLKLIQKQKRI